MTRTTDDPKTHTLQMRVSRAFLRRIDGWRRKQPDRPSRSEAIRRICLSTLSEND
jgi:hypothetical protein